VPEALSQLLAAHHHHRLVAKCPQLLETAAKEDLCRLRVVLVQRLVAALWSCQVVLVRLAAAM
jgi:hypothetical protein